MDNDTATEDSENDLRVQIAQEERLIRIYEAELNLMNVSSRRNESHWTTAETTVQLDATDHDWSKTLEALHQSNETPSDTGNIELNSRWHDDPAMYRLLPLVSGIAFTAALPHVLQHNDSSRKDDTSHRMYEFTGNVTAKNATPVAFKVVTTIEFDEQQSADKRDVDHQKARIIGIESEFDLRDTSLSAKEELDKISEVASETLDLPLLYRQLSRWAEFDLRRKRAIQNWTAQYGADAIQRVTADRFRVQVSNAQGKFDEDQDEEPLHQAPNKSLILVVSWKWSCFWHGAGDEELKLVNVALHGLPSQSRSIEWWANEIRQPQGLENLISCVRSNEKAIAVLLQTLFSTDDTANERNGLAR